MAEYPPPIDTYPIFDSLAFTAPLSASITQANADVRYLARQGSATSIATLTSFSNQIVVGTNTVINQNGNNSEISNSINSAIINCLTNTSGGVTTTPLSLSSTSIVVTPSQIATGLNGLVCNSAMFGRDDTTANSFNGTLNYTRYPIGWTISASKVVAIPTSNVTVDIISTGTPITVFNNLSNGVWRISCSCNNSAGLGAMTYAVMGWGVPTGATIINGTTAQLFHQTTAGLSNMGLPYPDLILRTTGNGVTGLICNFTTTYSVQPTITFNLWATKIA